MNLATDVTAEEMQVFLEEAEEQIALLDRSIVGLEKNGGDPQLLQEIFRAAHTIKGSSAMLGHQRMTELTHAMESLLDLLRKGKLEISEEIVDCLLQGLDILKMLREELILQEESDVDVAPAVAKLREVAGKASITDRRRSGDSRSPSSKSSRHSTGGCVESAEEPSIERAPGGGDCSVEVDGNDEGILSLARQEERRVSQSVRVDVRTLDNLMNMVEELVVDRSRMVQINRMLESKYGDDNLIRDLSRTSNHIVKVINELQQDVMRVRMLPIGTLFGSFPRLVRDLARQQRKTLNFVVEGEHTELDRTIIEKIRDPLVHLLRNAVDHGVEAPEERKAVGKTETAVVRLSAYQEEGHIVITLVDDGRGIEASKVRDASVQKGLVAAEEASRLTDAEAMDLIFLAGISTVEMATEVSGRGVGLDVVKTNIEALGGSVRVESKVGQGTKFTIILPLTVTVIQGLMVSSQRTTYILPLSSVTEILRLGPREITTIKGKEVIRLRDRIVPLVRIETVRCIERPATNNDGARIIVIAGDMSKAVGIVVDELVDQQEFVVKPLGKYLTNVRALAGATILGDGRVGLVVDIPTLIRTSTSKN
jgi:two-component system, chemotaxis family, sensor kinase CheA